MLLPKYASGALTRVRLGDGGANESTDEVGALLCACDVTGEVGAGVKEV